VNIVVTGAGGFLGGALVERLLAHGVREVGVVTRPGGKRTRLDEAASRYPNSRLRFIEANVIAPADARKAVEGADVVYHLAAAMKGAPADMYLNGVVGTKTLLEAIAAGKRKTRVVLVSSFGVYGVADQGRGALVNEDTPLESHPERRDVYSQVKLRQEQLARELAPKLGLDLVVLRPGVIYGPGGSAFSSRVGLNLFGVFLSLGGSNLLPLSYVDNCAEAIVLAGQAPGAAGQAYNVNDDDLPTCRDYLREYKKQVTPVRSVPVPTPSSRCCLSASNVTTAGRRGSCPPSSRPTRAPPRGAATSSTTARSRRSGGNSWFRRKKACAVRLNGCEASWALRTDLVLGTQLHRWGRARYGNPR